MSSTSIPSKTRLRLWVAAGGRCEYPGCNQRLFRDDLTLAAMNTAYIAHIVADSPNGPRGDKILSEKLAKEFSNLMLLCDVHHRLIDKEDVDGHPVELLTAFKAQHEDRIDRLTGIDPDRKSYIVTYAANIDIREGKITRNHTLLALAASGMYPATDSTIHLDVTQNAATERSPEFWKTECHNIDGFVQSRLSGLGPDGGTMDHLSVFAIGPMPLLMYLGKALGDIRSVDVYEKHRDNNGRWEWFPYEGEGVSFSVEVISPARHGAPDVIVELSLSDLIDGDTIERIMGPGLPKYRMSIPNPSPGFLRTKQDLLVFRSEHRRLLSRIMADAGKGCTIHLFPAVPVSIAVEIGRMVLPKSDVPIVVYDFNRDTSGWTRAVLL